MVEWSFCFEFDFVGIEVYILIIKGFILSVLMFYVILGKELFYVFLFFDKIICYMCIVYFDIMGCDGF